MVLGNPHPRMDFSKNDTPENQKHTESSAASNQQAADQPSAAMNEQIGEPT